MVEPRRRPQPGSGDAPSEDVPLSGVRVLIVQSDYYDDIAVTLLAGAERALAAAGAAGDVVTVTGALEIPQAAAFLLDAAPHYAGVVALGCVIRGETSHYDIVAGESARALMDIALARKIPVGNGILTVDTAAQAQVRAALDGGDKGGAAARAVLSLLRLQRGQAARAAS